MSHTTDLKKDWSRPDIVAALHNAGWSLRALSRHHGYACSTTLQSALFNRYPKAQKLIAAAIGIDPWEIWPSRYDIQNCSEDSSVSNGFRTPSKKGMCND